MSFLFHFSLIPESVRWMRLNNKTKEAEEILKNIAKRNKMKWPNIKLSNPKQVGESVSAKYLFVPLKMGISTILQAIAWYL